MGLGRATWCGVSSNSILTSNRVRLRIHGSSETSPQASAKNSSLPPTELSRETWAYLVSFCLDVPAPLGGRPRLRLGRELVLVGCWAGFFRPLGLEVDGGGALVSAAC